MTRFSGKARPQAEFAVINKILAYPERSEVMASEHYEEKERFDGEKVKILVTDYVQGKDEDRYQWRSNIPEINVAEGEVSIKKYLTTAERYFYSQDWFGSEKRKTPA